MFFRKKAMKTAVLLFMLTLVYKVNAQTDSLMIHVSTEGAVGSVIRLSDSANAAAPVSVSRCDAHDFKLQQLILPVPLIVIGFVGLDNDWLRYQNGEMRDELQENIDRRFTVDDFSQYAPMASVYVLNLCGVKGIHGFWDRTILLATSTLLMGITNNTLKYSTKIERPDGSSYNSFPSGHTAMAFVGAEFLWKEYKDVSPWIGVAGYSVAAGTGFFRMYNNRHWFTDVITGAGIGILSTKIAYWSFPYIENHLFKKKKKDGPDLQVIASPYLNGEEKGFVCSVRF